MTKGRLGGAPGSARAPLAGSWRSVALVVVGLLALVGVAGAALAVGRQSLDAAMDQRVADRTGAVEHLYRAGDTRAGNDTFVERIRTTPLSPTDPALNALPLMGYVSTRTGDPVKVRFIVRHDGAVVGQDPPTEPLPPMDVLEEALTVSRGGEVGISPVFELPVDDGAGGTVDQLFWARTYPVGGDDLWGSLVMVEPVTTGSTGELFDRLGAFTSEDGGLTLLDPDGVAAFSWDSGRVGTRPLDDEEYERLGAEPVVWTTDVGGEDVVRIGIRDPDRPADVTMLFEQDEADLFGDLREAQRQRDVSVLVVSVAAVLALVVFTALRQRAVRRSESRVELLMRSGHDVVLVVDDAGALSFISPAAQTMLGQDPADWVGRPLVELVADDHADRVAETLAESRTTGEASLLGVQLRSGDGRPVWFDLVFSDRRDPTVAGVLVTCREVGDRKRLEDQLTYQAGHDALSGLANRARFEATLAEVARTDGPFTVMVVDLDRFKQLNDSLGHAAGDAALKAVADGMQQAVRGDGDLVGRLGGDEFGVIVPGVTEADAGSVAARIGAAVRSVWPVREGDPGLDASIGIAMAKGPIDAPENVVRDADAAMYAAKRAGGGRAVTVTIASDRTTTAVVPAPSGSPAADVVADDGHGNGSHDAGGKPRSVESRSASTAPRAAPAGAASRPLLAQVRGAAVLLVTLAIVTGVAAVGVAQSRAAQEVSEDARLRERSALLGDLADVAAMTTDAEVLRPLIQATPWDTSSPELMALILEVYAESPALGTHGMAAALEPDGDVIAVHPPGTDVAIDTTDPRWARALQGETYIPELVHDGELLRFYLVAPHTTPDGAVDFVVVAGLSPAGSDWGATAVALGALGTGTGGSSTVDANGRAIAPWDPSLTGTTIVDPALLREADADEVTIHREVVDGEEMVTMVSLVPGGNSQRYMIWQQSADDLFGDLRAGQTARDVSVFGLLVLAVLALALVNRRRERALRRNAARLAALLEQANDLVVVVDPGGRIRFASAAVQPLFGLRPDEVVDRPLAGLIGVGEAQAVLTATRASSEAGANRSAGLRDVDVVGPHGEQRLFDVDCVDLRQEKGVGGYLLTFHEISERKELQDRLTREATHDVLTGLANRALFNSLLGELAADRRRKSGSHAVVFLDLDHFKPVNDRYGHQAGDELLQVIAGRLTAAVRSDDVVCRLGGDEFAILLAECTEEQARETAQRLLETVRMPVSIGDVLVSVDASIGVALSRASITHPEQLIREADQAMYRAKRSGRGRFVVDA